MKALMMLVGVCAMAAGILFIGQGMGYVRWPATSFMIDERIWVFYGGAIAAVGLILILAASRFKRS